MIKHYAFIPLKDKDLSSFRKSLITNLVFRSGFAILMLGVLAGIGHYKRNILVSDIACLFVFSIAVALILYLIFIEIQKLLIVGKIHKSSLLPYIHVRNSDASFYIEEITSGFIVQTQPVNMVDISTCKTLLIDLNARFCVNKKLADYLHFCMDSSDDRLVNKAVVYIEIMRDQLAFGNLAILDTYDKIKNYKEEHI